jgi:hypothetical protein
MSESVKCRSCANVTPFDPTPLYEAIKAGEVTDGGTIGGGMGWSGVRCLAWTCPECRLAFKKLAGQPIPIEYQMARIRAGQQRLEAAGKARINAIDGAVNSQMNEDERHRFPAFYHWLRERDHLAALAVGAWRPPVEA